MMGVAPNDVILGKLNPQQKIAVESTEGPLLVFAGAGSGKTRVITNRIAYLVTQKKVSPENILAVTFTKKAAGEMQERVAQILEELGVAKLGLPLIGTFHSIGALLLRQNAQALGLSPNFSIYDSDDSENLVKDLMVDQDIDIKQIRPKAVSYFISAAKNDMISPEAFPSHYGGYIEDIVADIYPQYQKQLKAQNAVDFGDLLYLAVQLLSENKEILESYQDKFKYIMIDEYQDTNNAQYLFAKLLSEKYKNICVVGDDDQGIYAWRGADIKNIQSFEKDFDNVKVVKLEQNYRSTANVINAAVAVIKQNNVRVDKNLWTEKGEGDVISIYQAQNQDDEAQYVIDEINNLKSRGTALSDVAVLYRTNYQSRVIEETLLKSGLPYKLVGGFRFYERKEIKDVLSYMRFLYNPKDELSLNRVLNVPTRKIGPKTAAALFELAKECGCSAGELLAVSYELINSTERNQSVSSEVYSKVDANLSQMGKFTTLINVFGGLSYESRGLDVLSVIDLILSKTRYVEWMDDGSEAAEYKKENIEELKNVASTYANKYGAKSLDTFLQEINLIEQEQDKNQDGSNEYINLMTLHSSKGLEFNNVFMIGMEEGILPHSRSFADEEGLEEERRLCYVGITRAREKLYMTFAEQRQSREGFDAQIPSRFLGEIPQEICEYYSWQM